MPIKIDHKQVKTITGSRYPRPFDVPVAGRARQRLGDSASLTQFGVNFTRLAPGAWSSQRHWHSAEDEFIYILQGELVLVTDSGEEILRPGDCAGFRAGVADGHHLQNRTDREAILLEVGGRSADDECTYPDIDLKVPAGRGEFTRKNGEPYA